MEAKVDMKGRDRKGILSVIGCSMAIFWSGALIFGYPGLMGDYWRSTFNVNTSATGLIMTFVIISLGVFMFFTGKWHMKLGTRKSYLIGTGVLLVAMFFGLFATNIYMIYLWGFLNGAASCFIYGPGLTTVQNWFPQRRGLVTGIVNLVFGSSAAVMSPIFNIMLMRMGYVKMNWIVIILILVVNVIAAFLSEMPDKSNMTEAQLRAHQELLDDLARQREAGKSKGPAASMTPQEALKTKNFWYLWITWCFMGAAGISMVSLSKGYGNFLALNGVLVLTCFNITNGLSRIVAGTLSDLIGRNTVGSLSFILAAIGYACLPAAHSLVLVCVLAAFVGFAFGTLFAITAPIGTDLFGLKYFGMIFGLIFTAYGFVGGIIGPLLSSYILQTTGSYTPVFTYLAVFSVIAAVFIMLARKKEPAVAK